MFKIKNIFLALMLLINLTSLQAISHYVDYWETLQEEKGHLTISSIWKETYSFRFLITEDQGSHAPMLLTIRYFDMPTIEDAIWEVGDLVVFKFLSEEDYFITNLRTQTTVVVKESWISSKN